MKWRFSRCQQRLSVHRERRSLIDTGDFNLRLERPTGKKRRVDSSADAGDKVVDIRIAAGRAGL